MFFDYGYSDKSISFGGISALLGNGYLVYRQNKGWSIMPPIWVEDRNRFCRGVDPTPMSQWSEIHCYRNSRTCTRFAELKDGGCVQSYPSCVAHHSPK